MEVSQSPYIKGSAAVLSCFQAVSTQGIGYTMDSRCKVRITPSPPAPHTGGSRRARRILIVDDHAIVRQGLRQAIENEAGMVVCGEAETERDARNAIRESDPDAMIVELNLRQGDGMALVRDARAHHPQLAILVFSMHDETIYAERLLACGANGYLMKQASSDQLLISLWRVLGGGIYVSESVGNNMICKMVTGGSHRSADPIDRLSIRELQILRMIGKGISSREAALSLNLSIKTIESHRQRVMRKLQLESGCQLLRYAVGWFNSSEAASGMSS
jgi:DNA-binding NarL/FixJ family response regulator